MNIDEDFDPSKPLKNSQHERFAIAYFENGGNGTQACITAGYAKKSASNQGKRLTRDDCIRERLRYLRDGEWEEHHMSIAERRARLSQIARADASDYIQVGADGSWVGFDKDSPNTQAVKSIKCKTDEDGMVITEVQLRDPEKSMDMLNKMDGAYAPEKTEHGFTGDVIVVTQVPEPDPLPDEFREDAE